VKVTVLVRPKDGILDPQGEAIARSLAGLGYPTRGVRAGRVFDLELEAGSPEEAERVAREVAGRVLANDLIERFDVVVHEAR
jgi:phosphoribosylformylglycinamidine synthase subunit PurS